MFQETDAPMHHMNDAINQLDLSASNINEQSINMHADDDDDSVVNSKRQHFSFHATTTTTGIVEVLELLSD